MVTSHPDHVLIFHQLFFNLWKIPFMFRYVLDRGICFLPLLNGDGSSIIKSDNLASIRVAESIGMRKEDTFLTRYYSGEMLHFLYSVYRETRC